jgi:hypothetical protein
MSVYYNLKVILIDYYTLKVMMNVYYNLKVKVFCEVRTGTLYIKKIYFSPKRLTLK